MEPKGIVVTGANGYLGKEVCRFFEGRTRVVALARSLDKLKSLDSAKIECSTYDDFTNRVEEGDVFVHCAAKTSHRGRYEDYLETNVNWTLELFEKVKDRISLFVFISSVAAAGYSNRPGLTALTEATAPLLLEGEHYGRTKELAERRLAGEAKKSSVRLVSLRAGLIYEADRLARPQSRLSRGTLVDPRERVPLVNLSNFFDALDLAIRNDEVKGTFFVVDDEQPTREELVELLIENGLLRYRPWRIGNFGLLCKSLLSETKRILRGGEPTGAWLENLEADLAVHRRRSRYDTAALREATGWVPKIGLLEGLQLKRDGTGD
jgi:nucleoside-diphosphate-sugar epimerase